MRKRRLHRRERKLRNKKIIIASICLICIMSVGFAAFQTNLSLTAKGNIKEMTAAKYLKTLITSSGDGLYKSIYEDNRYIYRGAAPNNFIKFNDELWRIISIESDNTIKIIKEKYVQQGKFDTIGNRTDGYCSLGNAIDKGCNVWSKTNSFINGNYSGEVQSNSTIYNYLNTTYYESLNDNYKKYIVSGYFKYGPVNYSESIFKNTLTEENKYKVESYVGLITISDYIYANNDNSCLNIYEMSTEGNCVTSNISNNWIHNLEGNYIWTLTPMYNSTNITYFINAATTAGARNGIIDFGNYVSTSNVAYNPVIYLSSSIKLSGQGTESQPYQILNN